MRLIQLRLHDFRSYKQLSLSPPEGITVFVGENGTGKTNLLEAVHLCCLGRSHRTNADRDMIRTGCDTCAVHARVEKKTGSAEVGVRLYTQQKNKKLIYVNGKTAPRIGELMGHMVCVMFSPEDLDIVKGPPAYRRRFIDMLLSQCQSAYFYSLQRYNTVLKQRNALLKTLVKSGGDHSQLSVWDEQLATAAVPVIRARRQAAEWLGTLAGGHYAWISDREKETLQVAYRSALPDAPDTAESIIDALRVAREDDLRRQATSVGPHRDDLDITMSGSDMRAFASQGQIRTAVLSMRLAEIDILTAAHNDAPLLLLDDVLSELDAQRRARLLMRLRGVQTLLTSTDESEVGGLHPSCILKVKDGMITM